MLGKHIPEFYYLKTSFGHIWKIYIFVDFYRIKSRIYNANSNILFFKNHFAFTFHYTQQWT